MPYVEYILHISNFLLMIYGQCSKGAKMEEERRLMEPRKKDHKYSGEKNSDLSVCVNDDRGPNELVYFNVSGRQFITTNHTLYNFPNSLIGTREKRNKLKRTKSGEIFFDRQAAVFESLLTFFQTGILEPPAYVNQNVFVSDVKFYELTEEAIASGLKGFDTKVIPMPKRKFQAYLWTLLEYPDSSFLARIVSMFSLLIIITSIITFCWETIPKYNKDKQERIQPPEQLTVAILDDIEIFCIIYFTIEIIVRFTCAPLKCAFLKDILNIIDIVSVLPFYITHVFSMNSGVSIYFLRAVRLVRVFRVFKLSRHSNEMKILGIAVKDSGRELAVLLFFILLAVLLFSSAVYYAEDGSNETKMTSIPGAFWWSVVTMTTVGYGDVVPSTIPGRIVGAMCAMTGILVIAMPIPIIVNNFTRQYQRLKPVSRFWDETREKKAHAKNQKESIIGLYDVVDLNLKEPKNVNENNHSDSVRNEFTEIGENVHDSVVEIKENGNTVQSSTL